MRLCCDVDTLNHVVLMLDVTGHYTTTTRINDRWIRYNDSIVEDVTDMFASPVLASLTSVPTIS